MINYLKGVVQYQKNDSICLMVAGFGLQITIPENSPVVTGSEIALYMYMHWNQEQGPSLFGFSEIEQRDLFCLLISVSGIGPRMALALLSAFPVATLIEAIVSGNIALLSSVSGIGRKKAETLIVHLKDKAEKIPVSALSGATAGFAVHLKELSDALISLGYSRAEIMQAVDQIRGVDNLASLPFDQLLRRSLQALAKK